VEKLVGEVYTLLCEGKAQRSGCSEFSTLLNSTARYDHADIGLAVCMVTGERASTKHAPFERAQEESVED